MSAALGAKDDSYYVLVWQCAYQGARWVTCLNDAECQEIAQDVVVKALSNANLAVHTTDRSTQRAYWRRAGCNKGFDYLRAQKARRVREGAATPDPDVDPWSDPTASVAVDDDKRDAIRKLGEKGEMYLRYCDGRSISEIAAEFDRDRKTVTKWLKQVWDILRRQFGELPDDPPEPDKRIGT